MALDTSRWTLWIKRGAFAITDQGLMSGSNFVLTILLARWLAPEQYGAYALALSIFYFIAAIHQALVLEPLSVLGTSEYSERQGEYGAAILFYQAAFSILLIAIVGASALAAKSLGNGSLAAGLAGLSLSGPGILLFWTARMCCYVNCTPSLAASGAALYSVILLAGAFTMASVGILTAFTALLLMGAAACVVGIGVLALLRTRLSCSGAMLRDVAQRHWGYGRWALGSSLVIWVPANIFYSIATAILGIGSAGTFRALMNLIFPVTHTCSALSLLFQPQLSRIAKVSGPGATVRPVARMAALYAAGALSWLALVAFQTERVWKLLYQGRYAGSSGLLIWLLVGVVFQVSAYAPAVGLRALQSPSRVFYAYSIAALTCVCVGIPATRIWGLTGAVASYSAALLLSFSATVFLFRRRVSTLTDPAEINILRERTLSLEAR